VALGGRVGVFKIERIKNMFQITKQGRARVRTPEFCSEVEEFVRAGICDGMDEGINDAGLVILTARALAGVESINLEDLPEEEFSQFMLDNASEINSAIEYCQNVSLSGFAAN
jgi:hypothetical protein